MPFRKPESNALSFFFALRRSQLREDNWRVDSFDLQQVAADVGSMLPSVSLSWCYLCPRLVGIDDAIEISHAFDLSRWQITHWRMRGSMLGHFIQLRESHCEEIHPGMSYHFNLFLSLRTSSHHLLTLLHPDL
jgi:hypothetical protein